MKIKNVVKVMNFHALVRVDKARREAEKYFLMEEKLRSMINAITNNMNLMLDKVILTINKDAPKLNIYIGSDMGFCGGYNYSVNEAAYNDDESDKIIIGKKVWDSLSNIVLRIEKDDYLEDSSELDDFISKAVLEGKYSQINILFNQYVNTTTIRWVSLPVYPFELDFDSGETYTKEDFACESDLNALLRNMISTYVCFETKILAINSYASENIMRESSTSESLKKIDEIEEMNRLMMHKERRAKEFQKTVENYTRLRYMSEEN